MMRSRDKGLLPVKKSYTIWVYSIIVIVILVMFAIVFNKDKSNRYSLETRTIQHIVDANTDSSVGPTEVNPDGTVDPETFATHLPLIIIDTNGEEIINIYEQGEDQSRQYIDPNFTDPYVDVSFTVINNDSKVNRIDDKPYFSNNGKIKMRGNSSRGFPKKQYGIKLLDEKGEELEYPLLGMEKDEDWVLCNSILDATHIRSYMAYNLGGLIDSQTPEVRFCEVLRKEGDQYEYLGLYLLSESVKKSKGRTDVKTYEGNTENLSYIVARDRYDYTGTMVPTYGSDNQITYGWYNLIYPKGEKADEETVKAIGDEISEIEKTVYSEDNKEFMNYSQYIDVDSFVDYFILNEFLMNYDAGLHSEYYYKDQAHKFSAGPFWDFDNCLDNYVPEAGAVDWIVFTDYPMYEKLVKDPLFCQKLSFRYKELRKTILSDRFIEEFVNDTVDYLGNASLREDSRWKDIRDELYSMQDSEADGFLLVRARDTYEGEIQRLLDTQQLHGAYLDKNLKSYLNMRIDKSLGNGPRQLISIAAIMMFAVFVVSVSLVSKLSRGEIK